MYIKNNNVPNIDPWRIPQLISLRSELIVTTGVLFLTYEENQLFVIPLTHSNLTSG